MGYCGSVTAPYKPTRCMIEQFGYSRACLQFVCFWCTDHPLAASNSAQGIPPEVAVLMGHSADRFEWGHAALHKTIWSKWLHRM